MKIAIVYDAIYPYVKGGAEKRIYELAKKLSENNEIHLFGMKYWKGDKIIKKGDNLYLHGVCKAVSLYNKKGQRNIWEPFYFSVNLFKEIIRYKFDVIECQNFPYIPVFTCKLYSLLKKKPLIITWLEIYSDNWRNIRIIGNLGSLIERLSFKLTDKNIVLSKRTARKLKNKSIILPVGIDLKKLQNIKANKKEFDIIFVGRLIKDKKVDILLRAISKLSLKICIIGSGPEKEFLIRLAKNLNLNVKFIDFLDEEEDVYRYMKASKILVLPSIREGFGVVILEGLACGCKVITTNHYNNNSQDLVDKKFICDPNIESLRNKIIYGLKNKYHNKINLKDYDIEKIAKKLEGYYKGVSLNEI